jgi:hypothetical protein
VNRAAVREIADLYFERFQDRLEKDLANLRTELIKWMFVFWIGMALPLTGLVIALLKR